MISMANARYFRSMVLIVCILYVLPCIAKAGDEQTVKASEQWSRELKRLVVLSRLIAHEPSLLSEKPSSEQVRELSAEPFGCKSPDVSECILSKINIVLLQQSTGSASIFAETPGAAVQMRYRRATDVWSGKDIENNWDVVKKWTDAMGPAAILVGAFMLSQQKSGNSSDTAAAIIGSGATLILIGNIGTLGQLYGGVNDKQRARVAKKTINTLQDIEDSRRAYEDSQLIYGLLDSYSERAGSLLRALLALSDDAGNLSRETPSPARSKRIVELCDKTRDAISGFKEAAGLAGDYANQLLRLYKENHDEALLPEEKKAFEDARQRVKKFSDDYDEVVAPFLQSVPDEIEAMGNIKAAVIATGIADKQYF